MSNHHHPCPDCQDDNHQELQDLVENEEMTCCQEKNQSHPEVKPRSLMSKFTSIFKKND